ncbi:SDR family oxidoreductase [Bradyrhizobium sp. Pear77]|nr:SDR family oxidoreductase [Bradyrhizobium altum]
MKDKVVVITRALGALGNVVAEEALSLGARVAAIDHAASQLAATAERIELGRIDLTDAAIPHLLNSRAVRIVNIGAMGALRAGSGMGPYAASKASLHKLTESLAAELKGKITVNAVPPSVIDTAANRASMPKADPAKWVRPTELADVILFLASDAASAVTGALLPENAATSFRSTVRNRMLGLPASAVASHFPPSSS